MLLPSPFLSLTPLARALLLASGLGLSAAGALAAGAAPATAAASAPTLRSGLDASGRDPSVRPQDNLYLAVNGQWIAHTELPADRAIIGSFIALRELSDERTRGIVEALVARPPEAGTSGRKIADYYAAHLDTAAIDQAGMAPAAPLLAAVDAIQDPAGLVRFMGQRQGVQGLPLRVYVGADRQRPDINTAYLSQGGLGLPDRDYYLKDDPRFVTARAAYLRYVQVLLKAAGDAEAEGHAAAVLALETQLATAQWTRVELRNPVRTYNPMAVAGLTPLAPGVDWPALVQAGGLPADATVVVVQPSYLTALAGLLRSVPLATWRVYLRVRALDDYAGVLPQPLRDAAFQLRGATLDGLAQERPRWQQSMEAVNTALGEAVGERYVAQYFPPTHKARMEQLVANLMAAYRTSIDRLSWMSPATQAEARDKLSKYATKIGYPARWRDYTGLEVKAGDAFGNQLRQRQFERQRNLAKFGQKVDRSEWGMTPQTVNAYYNGSNNEIVFPAAILQPPFFDAAADDAANYGGIGAVIGHEISHGFDDQGSQFDGDGRLRNWWTEADRQAFDRLAGQLAAQYDAYEPIPGKHINGKLTLGENIADLSGLQIAFKAYQRSLGGQPAPVIDGLTGEQRFFLGWAQVWRQKQRDARALQQLVTDPHSPGPFRANGAAINHDGFHEAFGTHPGDALYKAPADRIRLW